MMRRLRSVLSAVGAAIAAIGVFFLFQGMGVIRWPAESFMVGDQVWVTIGSGIAAIGLLLVLLARRLR